MLWRQLGLDEFWRERLTSSRKSTQLDKQKLREAWRRENRYLLHTNMNETDPAKLWEFYFQPTEVEQAFKELKGDLALRPIYHPLDRRSEAHIFCELWNAIREDDVYLSSNPRSWASALSVVR